MKFEINEGDDAVCSYSGKQQAIVIRFEDLEGNQTGWFGSEVLEKALRLMHLSAGVPYAPAVPQLPQQYQTPYTNVPFVNQVGPMAADVQSDVQNMVSHQPVQQNQPVQRRQATPRSPEEKQVVEGFAKDLVSVITKREAEDEKVTGKDLVKLIMRWKNSFRRIENALPILSAHMGKMDKDQFENLVLRSKIMEKEEREEGDE